MPRERAEAIPRDEWLAWLSQAATQEYFARLDDRLREMEYSAGHGKTADPNNADRTQYETGVANGFCKAIEEALHDTLPKEVMRELGPEAEDANAE